MAYDHIFEALITIVVGLALLPVVTNFTDAAAVNASATTTALLGLIPLFWVLAVVAVAIYMAKRGISK